jgi:hypothetical protein
VKARLVAAIGVAVVVGLATFYFTQPGSVSELPPGGGGATGAPGVPDPIRSGEAQTILATYSFWFGWADFFPNTVVYR